MKVRDILVEHKQGYYKPGEFETGDIHLVRISDITNEAYINENTTPMINVNQDVLANFDVKKNDFLFARTGGAGRFALVRDDIRGIFASYLIRFRFMPEYDPSFLRYYFLSSSFQFELKSTIHGGVNQNIHAENIKDCSVPIFSLPEQQRIVSVLDEVFASIAGAKANAERNLVNARELFEVVAREIFEIRGDDWDEEKVNEVCELKSGTTIPTSLERNKGDVLYTKIADMNLPENLVEIHTSSRFVNSDEINENQIIPEGGNHFPEKRWSNCNKQEKKNYQAHYC
jgi:type I restriction enzyme, S subunit